MTTTEEWRDVPGFEGMYEVSSHGRVRSKRRLLTRRNGSPYIAKSKIKVPYVFRGYLRVALWRDGKNKALFVHRLVLLAFAGPPPHEDMQAHHFPDPDPSNNHVDNLSWVTRAVNHEEMVMRNHYPLSYLIEFSREPGSDDGPVVWGDGFEQLDRTVPF